jgi:hypothetical protein
MTYLRNLRIRRPSSRWPAAVKRHDVRMAGMDCIAWWVRPMPSLYGLPKVNARNCRATGGTKKPAHAGLCLFAGHSVEFVDPSLSLIFRKPVPDFKCLPVALFKTVNRACKLFIRIADTKVGERQECACAVLVHSDPRHTPSSSGVFTTNTSPFGFKCRRSRVAEAADRTVPAHHRFRQEKQRSPRTPWSVNQEV